MRETTRRWRRTVILSSAPAAAVLAGVMIATAATSPAADTSATAAAGTAVATSRDLSATLSADGVVESASTSAIIYGRTAAVPSNTQATGGTSASAAQASTAQPASLSTSTGTGADLGSTIELVGYTSAVRSEEPTAPTATPTDTATPTETATPTPTETATPTTPPSTATPAPSTTAPAPSPTPTRPDPAGPTPAPTAPAGGGAPVQQPSQPSMGTVPAAGSAGQAGGQAGAQSSIAQPAKTLTRQASFGSNVTTGTTLYSVDGEPVVAVVATTSSWRTLKEGVSDGTDVRTLERALKKLGFGENLTVDNHFTASTADAVKDWEESLHRDDPDGQVDPTEIVIIDANSHVVDSALAVGDPVSDGSQVLTLASNQRVITANVPADDIAAWGQNATVTVQWADGDTFTGRVSAVSRDITNDSTDVTIRPAKGTIKHHTGTSADIKLVTGKVDGAVAVPVTALRDGPEGRPSVTVVENGVATVRSVEVGLVADGWAQVTSGVQAGEHVQLPGFATTKSDDS